LVILVLAAIFGFRFSSFNYLGVHMKYATIGLGLVAFGMVACAPASNTVGNGRNVDLSPLGLFADGSSSTAKGNAELILLADGKTKVTVTVTGLTANTKHIGHIHTGKCSAAGPVVILLNELTADATGKAKAETVVDTSKIPTSAYVQHHQRGTGAAEGAGTGIVCGDVN
jgi:hypothetical protein